MPVTKKKGAIFAIYSDSPSQLDSKSAANSAPTKSPSKQQRSTLPRKALSAVQPVSLRCSKSVGKGGNEELDKGKGKEMIELEKPLSITIKDESLNAKTRSTKRSSVIISKAVPTKRQFEVLASPTVATSSVSSKAVSQPPKTPKLQPAANLLQPANTLASLPADESPAKRLRSSPRRPVCDAPAKNQVSFGPSSSIQDKENIAPAFNAITPLLDSPAAHTRSRSKQSTRPGSISSLAQLVVQSPLRRSPRSLLRGANDSLPTAADILGSTDATTLERLDAEEGLVGGGRGTLTYKKGRGVALVLNDLGARVCGSPAKGKAGTPKGKGISVGGDGPLVDVSEAYGATGPEPLGFRE